MDKELKNKELEEVSGGNAYICPEEPLLPGREKRPLPKKFELYCKNCDFVIRQGYAIMTLTSDMCPKCHGRDFGVRDATK